MQEFSYAVEPLKPGRLPFHRWRWELWQGAWMLAAGWCTAPAQAEHALLRAASRRLHELRGVRALRPEAVRALDGTPGRGRTTRVQTGVGTCLLVPRELDAVTSRAA